MSDVLSLIDTHCDTAYKLYHRGLGLNNPETHISLDRTAAYTPYCQCMAVWASSKRTDEEGFSDFLAISDHLGKLTEENNHACLCRTWENVQAAFDKKKTAFILTVEDARILCGDIRRLDVLAEAGVKILTFQWHGATCIGGGFDTDLPLTPFGQKVLRGCFEHGIIPDISHACERTAREMIEGACAAGRPVIATHSNSRAVCDHPRNLTDGCFKDLIAAGGVAGISLAPEHLSLSGKASSDDVLRHIEHYAALCGIGSICLGCDFDGISTTPSDIRGIEELENLAEAMARRNYREDEIRAVFFENARRFLSSSL